MLTFLLFTLLTLHNIDLDASVLQYDTVTQEKIIEELLTDPYQSSSKIQRTLPPITHQLLNRPDTVITADSGVVIDTASGSVLWERNTDTALPIASLTKLMTALVFLDMGIPLENEVTVEEADASAVMGSRHYVKPGETMTVKDLFFISLVGSDNTATSALARSTGLQYERFIQLMNSKAENLGLTQTKFLDVTGLDPQNTSTVLEYSKIANFAMRNKQIREVLTTTEYVFETLEQKIRHRIRNTNVLLGDEDLQIIGAKTGYLDEAGYTFVCQASEDNHDILIVLFKSNSSEERFKEAESLIHWAYDYYYWL